MSKDSDLQPWEREQLAWLIIKSQTDMQIFLPELIVEEIDRYRSNPVAYTYDDPLFLLPYMEQIFARPSVGERRN